MTINPFLIVVMREGLVVRREIATSWLTIAIVCGIG